MYWRRLGFTGCLHQNPFGERNRLVASTVSTIDSHQPPLLTRAKHETKPARGRIDPDHAS
jgi:CBS domain-containing protein